MDLVDRPVALAGWPDRQGAGSTGAILRGKASPRSQLPGRAHRAPAKVSIPSWAWEVGDMGAFKVALLLRP